MSNSSRGQILRTLKLGGGGEMQETGYSCFNYIGKLSIQPNILELLKKGLEYRNFVLKFSENPNIVQFPNVNHSTKF